MALSARPRGAGRRRIFVGLGAGALGVAAVGGAAVAFRRQATAKVADPQDNGIHAHGVVTVRGTPEQVYAQWRDLPKLPHVLSHLREVRVLDQQRSRWTAAGERRTLTWDVELTDDVPGRELAWRSLPPAVVPTHGHVRFAPSRGGRGTEIHLDLSYSPAPGHDDDAAVFAAAEERQIRRDLRRFKRTAKAG